MDPRDLHPAHDVQVSRFETYLRRLLSIKRSGIISSVDANVNLSFDPLSDMRAEGRVHQGVRTYQGGNAIAGVAAQAAWFTLFNPVGSKMLAVVENFELRIATAQTLQILFTQTDSGFGSTILRSPVDLRTGFGTFGAPSGGSCLFTMGNAAAYTGATQVYQQTGGIAQLEMKLIGPVILPPGFGLVGGVITVNIAGSVAARWYERSLENSEIAG